MPTLGLMQGRATLLRERSETGSAGQFLLLSSRKILLMRRHLLAAPIVEIHRDGPPSLWLLLLAARFHAKRGTPRSVRGSCELSVSAVVPARHVIFSKRKPLVAALCSLGSIPPSSGGLNGGVGSDPWWPTAFYRSCPLHERQAGLRALVCDLDCPAILASESYEDGEARNREARP